MGMKKHGFTLIELMVVIVIIGILAGIGVPRLFGMTAKAKAAEVVIAFKTFQKLKDMHYELYGEETTSPIQIGFELPGDDGYFEYGMANIAVASSGEDGGISTAGQGNDKNNGNSNNNGNGAGSGEVIDGEYVDENHGHGNDPDGCDDDNPALLMGKGKKSCRDQNEDESSDQENQAPNLTLIANTITASARNDIGAGCEAGDGIYMVWTPQKTTFGNSLGGNCSVYMPTLFQ
jgi:prepilin-type N-terminal cleavage/methylation domain-containing protein